MMQSKLAGKLTAAVINRLAPRVVGARSLGAISGGGRAADPDTHAVDQEEVNDASAAAGASPPKGFDSGKGDDHYVPPGKPAFPPSGSSPRVQSTEVNPPVEPHGQQRRRSYSTTASIEVDCVGFDGSPLPAAEEEEDRAAEGRRQREEQEEDNKEYFKHHRASPLSELKIADTRKPITQASSGGAVEGEVGGGYFGTPEVQVWRPEQVDTAEEALMRAREIWTSNAIRGDPDSPHGRILRQLRGEDW